MRSLAVICFTLLICFNVGYCKKREIVFVYNKPFNRIIPYEIEYGDAPPPDWVVRVAYTDSVEKNGWLDADFTTNTKMDLKTQYYGAGYAEGYLTQSRISQMWNNTLTGFCDDQELTESCKNIRAFLQENLDWMKEMIKNNTDDKYWTEIEHILLQIQGVKDGYDNLMIYDERIRLKPFGFLLFHLTKDMFEVQKALGTREKFRDYVDGEGSGSALIKLAMDKSGKKDLVASHTTWSSYERMLRAVKRFTFGNYSEAYTGYPGSINSGDDFYILSTGLVVMETRITNWNSKLWVNIVPKSVLGWLRTMVANRLAKNGHEWCNYFMRYSSGTHNSQWMVVDYNEYEKQSSTDVLYVLEEIPGDIRYDDQTKVLFDQTYWASYNIPYYPRISSDSEIASMVKKYGDYYSYSGSPRAKIFERDHKTATDLDSMTKLMKSNDYKNDPLSKCSCTPPYSAQNAIAARSDLNPATGSYPFSALAQRDHGAIDVKVTSSTLRKTLGLMIECGPTHDDQPVFQWSKSPYADKSHLGHPDKYDFKAELHVWDK